jgi:hypothetical protein
MAWSFDVTSGIPRINQSGSDTGATPFAGIDTAIAAVGTVARNTPYTTASPPLKPPGANGMWYRCSQNGTTGAAAPTFDPTNGSVTTDGTAKFTAFRAPSPLFCGTGSIYFLPDVRMQITGTLTNTNPQQQAFWCWDLITYGSTANFTSGSFASDGVTPLWDGLHFTCTRVMTNPADPGSLNMQGGSKVTLIGGEMQIASAIGVDSTSTLKAYYTRFRNTKEWGSSSSRIRNYSATSIYRKCEFYDVAFDRFSSPAEFSVKARGSEYLVQYVGSGNGGVNAKFVVSGVENIDGTNDIDNYGCGWMEAWNCAKGALLKVVTQNPGTAYKQAFFVPLFQDVAITAKNTLGNLVANVRYSCTDVPDNSPPSIITTFDGLKAWNFVNPLSYQTTSNASGVATAALALAAWWWKSSTNTFQTNLRFPLSTAIFEGRAYGYKTTTVAVVLGSDDLVTKDAGMVAQDTATILSEAAALALGKFTFTPSGATSGNVTATASYNTNELWDSYEAWITQFANRTSQDTWSAIGGKLNMGAWTLTVDAGVTGTAGPTIGSVTAAAITNSGSIKHLYTSGSSPSARLKTTGLEASSLAVLDNTGAVYDFADNLTGTKTEYMEPGKTGTYTAIAERLGFKRQTTTFSPGLGGDANFAPIWVPDVSLLVTDAAVIAARDHAATPNETLENACHWRTTSPGIPYDLVSKDGTSVVIACDVHFVATASTPIAYDSALHVMTIAAGAHHVPGTTLVAYRSPGKITIDAGVDFQCAYADVDGQRITVLGMDSYPLNVTWFMRYRIQGATSWTSITGTGNAKQLTLTAGIYEVEVRGDGYGWASGVIDTSKTLTLQLSRAVVLADDDTPQQLKAYNATLEAVFQFDPAAGAVAVTNTTGAPLSPGFGEVWRATQRIMNMPALVWTWDNPIKANALSQKIIIPDGNPITMYLTEDSTALVTITCPVVHEATGKSADDRVKGNTHGLYIKLGSQASAETAGLVDTIVSLLGGPAFDSGTHGLSKVKDAVSQVQTTVNALHNTDISSLATHADAVAIGQAVTALGQPLQASAYTAPTAAPSAAAVATAVRTELGTELANLDAKVSTRSTLKAADIPAGLTAAQVWTHADRSLTVASGLTEAQAQTLTTINTTVNALHNTDISGLATHADAMAIGQAVTALGQPLQASAYTAPTAAPSAAAVATAVRAELGTELAHLDADISTRSTLAATDIPAGLTADQVWRHTDRTLSLASGLTPEQQQALDDLQAAVADLLKAADYTAPPTAQAIATQVELAVLDDGDGRTLLQAIADKIGNENLSAATVAAAVWAASGRTLSAPSGLTDAQAQMLQDVLTAIGNLPDASTAAAATATALLGEPVEVGATVRGSLQLLNAFAAGHIKGAGSSTEKFTNLAGTKDVIVSTNDGNGNRRTVNIDVDRGA